MLRLLPIPRLGPRISGLEIALVILAVVGTFPPRVLAQDEAPGTTATVINSMARKGPFLADLGTVAQIKVPAGYLFIAKKDMRKFNDLYQNPTSSTELGALLPESHDWFIIFE